MNKPNTMIEIVFKHYTAGVPFVSWAIRAQTRSPYSHVAILIPPCEVQDDRGTWQFTEPTIYEATWPRVLRRPAKPEDDSDNVDDFILPVSEAALPAGLAFLDAQIGKRYDLSSVIRFVTRDQARRETAETWFCSELAFVFSQKIGRPLLANCWPWEVAPRDTSHSPIYDRVLLRKPRVPEWDAPLRPGNLNRR